MTMINSEKLAVLLTAAQEAAAAAKDARTQSLPDVVKAVRALEGALQAALDDEPLRGLKNIGTAGVSLYAARVRAGDPDAKLPHFADQGSAVSFLCIDTHGELINAWWVDPADNPDKTTDDWELHTAPITDDYIRVDDIEHLTNTLDVVLPRHVKSARKNAGRYLAMQKLALRMRDAMFAEDQGDDRNSNGGEAELP